MKFTNSSDLSSTCSYERQLGRRAAAVLAIVAVAALPLWGGCSHHTLESGWANPCKVQVQFYAPPGATVAVSSSPWWELGESDKPDSVPPDSTTRRHQVAKYGADDRLEQAPEEFAVFNLCPGLGSNSYHFKYTTAEGFPGVSIYGQLDVRKPHTDEAREFVANTFVPIVLPSRYYEGHDEHYFPVRGPSGVGLSQLEVEHLRQGDLIRKVYFVADLQKAWETIRLIDEHVERLRSAETVLNTELELVDARFEVYRQDALYADPTDDSLARYKDWSGKSNKFIELEARRQELTNERYGIRSQIDDLMNERRIRTRLLDSMKIVNRRGSLVLATPESQWAYHDAATQVGKGREYDGFEVGPGDDYQTGDITIPRLGDVVLEMKVGGRHKHWDAPNREMVAFNPEE